ncbi:hypothetical protein BO70DRAFT_345297 [Aspergillus heteromorphus CBS 117.55]|uniref:PD-(D/E)XK nuclease-like domain-containing protein n=1 Tax=Aspergillus heteromorphus CBS 117.55 TaxID=1448321 RepID=A0A317UZM9_9EURO|nr:uncharacterized protein BO70DRAFT_345297 [Aspergillus heteromorphus CBS 117.55]PWY67514.1 hypothetical protein BO70DRAFT_345297 [Aspergillus heteromorphus CBS 117.55]
MDGDKRRAIAIWNEKVFAEEVKRVSSGASNGTTAAYSVKRKPPSDPDQDQEPDTGKRPRQECPESPCSGPSPSWNHDIPVPQSVSRSESSPPGSSPSATRVKSQLATATPKVVFLQQTDDPGSDAVKDLLTFLLFSGDPLREGDQDGIEKISQASCRCTAEFRSEGSWVMDVVRPLLDLAIGDLSLESWSVQSESVGAKYLPRYTAKDTVSRTIDLVVGLPKEPWISEYERIDIDAAGRDLSHVDHPHTGKRLLGLGLEAKAPEGNLVEAQVQLAVWMAGLVVWGFDQRPPSMPSAASVARGDGAPIPPPVVGCTIVGEDWKFYIVYGAAGVDDSLSEVRVWGPLARLNSQTTTEEDTTTLLRRLRRVMQYIQGPYLEKLLAVMDRCD